MTFSSPQKKILVVDDHPYIVDEICEFLESSGYVCVPCHSSRQAIQLFHDDPSINLVLCDLLMPEYDGVELFQALKLIAGTTRVFEAIMLTGFGDKQDVIRALREGFSDYYQKPVDLNELLAGLKRREKALLERQTSTQHLGDLSQKLYTLIDSINDLSQDIGQVHLADSATSMFTNRENSTAEAAPPIFNQLSPRQLQVAQLVSTGQTNFQIACEMGITENTVKLYVSQVLRLTETRNRTQLALALTPGNSRTHPRSPAY